MWKIILLVAMGILLARTTHAVPDNVAATQPALSSKPTEWDGLQVTVTLPKATLTADEPLAFTLRFKNISNKPFTLCDPDHFWSWATRFTDVKTAEPWTLRELFGNDRIPESVISLKPDGIFEVPVGLVAGKDRFDFGLWGDPQKRTVPPIKHLRPGKYRLTIEISLRETPVRGPETIAPFWIGTIATQPLDLEITEKPATQPAG